MRDLIAGIPITAFTDAMDRRLKYEGDQIVAIENEK